MPIDDRTANLNLPKPNQSNTLLEDVARLRAALDGIDAAVSGKQAALGFTPENAADKGQPGGYASLDGTGKVPAAQLPSFVDDVLEFANLAALPGTGETGKIYVTLDTGRIYRWSGSVYVEISPSPGTTDALVEGSTNLYFTPQRARDALQPATAAALGAIKVGAGLTIGGDGTLSTNAVNKTGDSMTGALNEAAALTTASGATVEVGSFNANTINITGTTTITSLGTAAAGVIRRLVFQGSLTLTHNATSLILPGGANITTAAGDVGEFLSLGSGNWRCVAYQTAGGTALVTPSRSDTISVIGANTSAERYTTYVLTASLTLTLPASPAVGDWVLVINRSGTTTPVIARNGKNIMGLAEDMTLDNTNATLRLVFVDATNGWVLN